MQRGMTSSTLRVQLCNLLWLITSACLVHRAAHGYITAALLIKRHRLLGGDVVVPLDDATTIVHCSAADVAKHTIELHHGPRQKRLRIRASSALERKTWLAAIVSALASKPRITPSSRGVHRAPRQATKQMSRTTPTKLLKTRSMYKTRKLVASGTTNAKSVVTPVAMSLPLPSEPMVRPQMNVATAPVPITAAPTPTRAASSATTTASATSGAPVKPAILVAMACGWDGITAIYEQMAQERKAFAASIASLQLAQALSPATLQACSLED